MVRLHLFGQIILCIAVFRNNKKTGSVHIQSVDKAYLIAFSLIKHPLHQSVGYGMAWLSLGGVNHYAGLLIDNQKIIVLIDN